VKLWEGKDRRQTSLSQERGERCLESSSTKREGRVSLCYSTNLERLPSVGGGERRGFPSRIGRGRMIRVLRGRANGVGYSNQGLSCQIFWRKGGGPSTI